MNALVWIAAGLAAWFAVAIVVALLFGRIAGLNRRVDDLVVRHHVQAARRGDGKAA